MSRIINDLTGQRFGRLLVQGPGWATRSGAKWLCRCDCGNESAVEEWSLLRGSSRSCGCYRREHDEARRTDITGLRMGCLVAVERCSPPSGVKKPQGVYWRCKCDCGGEKVVRSNVFSFGQVQSCGCLRKQVGKAMIKSADMIGRRFGRLEVMRVARTRTGQGRTYECRCDCGRMHEARGKDLVRGNTTSCGCARVAARTESLMDGHFRSLMVPLRHGYAIATPAATLIPAPGPVAS